MHADDLLSPDSRVNPDRWIPQGRTRTEQDGANSPIKGIIGVGSPADRVAITQDGAFAFVKSAKDGSVSIIRTSDNAVVVTFGADGSVRGDRPRREPGDVPKGAAGPALVREIATYIRQLVATGALRSSWADAFLAELDAAGRQLRTGNPTPVLKVLHAFRNQLMHFANAGILTFAQADWLRLTVDEAIEKLSA